ncbi:MAG TPA: VWA domain-containing protein [Terriglobales bacterium]
MLIPFSSFANRLLSGLLCVYLAVPAAAQQQDQQQPEDSGFTIKVQTNLVLVNVVARDKQGNLIRNLKQSDFTVLEEGKPQQIRSFDFENVEQTAQTAMTGGQAAAATNLMKKGATIDPAALRDHRLIILFFDLTSMQPEELQRAIDSSVNYVDKQMTSADLVGILSLTSTLALNQDFTSDKDVLRRKLRSFTTGEQAGFEQGTTGADTDGTPDTGAAFSADDTEYNTFSNDLRLQALEAAVTSVSKIQQKKSLIYFSSGLTSTGLQNYATLRNAANAARKANVSIYTTDSRGLQALPPSGDASTASLRGTSSYSGAAFRNQQDQNFSSQETLSTIAEDTGGKAFLDTNDFSGVFARVQRDTSAYYVLGFTSNNPAKDGRFRKLTVKVNRPDIKLEYRNGYYAPKDFKHSNKEDREEQLADELSSETPSTDVFVLAGASYFRMADDRFYVPVSLVIPGSQIPFVKGGDKDKATIDVMGVVRDETKRPIGNARETVKLNLDESQQVRRKNVQYNTAFVLPPGEYHMKFVVRENQTGRLGSFETDVKIPDLKREKVPVKISSVVLGNQVVPATGKKSNDNPLVYDGKLLLPNIAHVFSPDQSLYLHYEVYDPAKPKGDDAAPQGNGNKKATERLLTSIQFFQGKTKVFETPVVTATNLNAPERRANVFEFAVPLSNLKPGAYTCQVSVIDDAAGTFVFPRTPVLVKAATSPAPNPQTTTGN